jgi:hypothetical protein
MWSKNIVRLTYALIVIPLTVASVHSIVAQPLLQRTFDLTLAGDDPGESFTFNLPEDPATPSLLRFDGFFQNLDSEETGVRYYLSWNRADGSGFDSLGTDFTRLPASGQLPVYFEQPIAFTPASVFFLVEGGGPGDNFRFAGDFTIEQVPEPGVLTLFAAAGALGLSGWHRSKARRAR